MNAMTGAHPTLPLPTWVRVTNLENGRSVVVRLNDRGPFAKDRIIDLSHAAAEQLDMIRKGTARVEVQSLAIGDTAPLPAAIPAYYAQAGASAARMPKRSPRACAPRASRTSRSWNRPWTAARCSGCELAPPQTSPNSTPSPSACALPARIAFAWPCNNESHPYMRSALRILPPLLLFAVSSAALAAAQPVPPPPALDAGAWVLVDNQSGQVLVGHRADEAVDPASITKLMTAYAVFQALKARQARARTRCRFSEHAWSAEGSRTYVDLGIRSVPVDVLIQGMIVQIGQRCDDRARRARRVAREDDIRRPDEPVRASSSE